NESVETLNEAVEGVHPRANKLLVIALDHRLKAFDISQGVHDFAHVREILRERHVVSPLVHGARVASGKQNDRSSQSRSLEDTRRDDVDHDVSLVWRKDVAMDVVERCVAVACEVL